MRVSSRSASYVRRRSLTLGLIAIGHFFHLPTTGTAFSVRGPLLFGVTSTPHAVELVFKGRSRSFCPRALPVPKYQISLRMRTPGTFLPHDNERCACARNHIWSGFSTECPQMLRLSPRYGKPGSHASFISDSVFRLKAVSHRAYGTENFGRKKHEIVQTKIPWPAGATSGFYTGVSHFRHVNNRNLVTFVFSAGRHAGGTNTYLTVDTSRKDVNPFEGVQEKFVNSSEPLNSTYTWASAYTVESDGVIKHLALFSGGNSHTHPVFIGPSRLYSFEENSDGSLQSPKLEWVENTSTVPAHFCLLADLGDIANVDMEPVSTSGEADIVISGYGGVQIYSLRGHEGEWRKVRSLPVIGKTAAAYVGLSMYQNPTDPNQRYLLIASRSEWNEAGVELDAPCFVYNYRTNATLQGFASGGQTVSVAQLDSSKVIVGAGGEADVTGAPNLIYDAVEPEKEKEDEIVLRLSRQQLVEGMPTEYLPFEHTTDDPINATQYYSIPSPNYTKTRQVYPFSLPPPTSQRDLVLEVNSAQSSCIYCRDGRGDTFRVLPVPDSVGTGDTYARGADVLVEEDKFYVVFAMYNGNNTVYEFRRDHVEKSHI